MYFGRMLHIGSVFCWKDDVVFQCRSLAAVDESSRISAVSTNLHLLQVASPAFCH